MIKIGIIGLGSICKKAYLPVITQLPQITLHLCTRNEAVLRDIAAQHRIAQTFSTVEQLVASGIEGAFVHTATESHAEICRYLLEHGVHVYVDKPVSYQLSETTALHQLAIAKRKILMVGFNRRYAPMISGLTALGSPNLILMQKNRPYLSGTPRVTIYDDFIHVLDTLRFFLGKQHDKISVDYTMSGENLKTIVVKLSAGSATAIGIMNRDNGASEEIVEYMASQKKAVVSGLSHTTLWEKKTATLKEFGDWEQTLTKRGFASIIQTFINRVAHNDFSLDDMDDWQQTHQLCEEILHLIENPA